LARPLGVKWPLMSAISSEYRSCPNMEQRGQGGKTGSIMHVVASLSLSIIAGPWRCLSLHGLYEWMRHWLKKLCQQSIEIMVLVVTIGIAWRGSVGGQDKRPQLAILTHLSFNYQWPLRILWYTWTLWVKWSCNIGPKTSKAYYQEKVTLHWP